MLGALGGHASHAPTPTAVDDLGLPSAARERPSPKAVTTALQLMGSAQAPQKQAWQAPTGTSSRNSTSACRRHRGTALVLFEPRNSHRLHAPTITGVGATGVGALEVQNMQPDKSSSQVAAADSQDIHMGRGNPAAACSRHDMASGAGTQPVTPVRVGVGAQGAECAIRRRFKGPCTAQ